MPGLGIAPGYALDLSTVDERGVPWDFDDPVMREKAKKRQRTEKPILLVGSPMCTEFSALLNISKHKRDPRVVAAKLTRARNHLKFCCEMYAYQVAHGRYFLHEHPLSAVSWQEGCINEIKKLPNVDVVTCHQCQYGAESDKNNPVRKATRFMSNSSYILDELSRRCSGLNGDCSRSGGGRHQHCLG